MKQELYPDPETDTFSPRYLGTKTERRDGESQSEHAALDRQSLKTDMNVEQDTVFGLVKQARAGNRTAIGRLIALFQDDLYRLVYYRIQSRMDADDFIQFVVSSPYTDTRMSG